MALSCPGCGSSLKTAHRGKVEVDLCPRCGGAWFDRDELRPVLAALASDENVQEDKFSPGPRKVVPAHQIEQMGRRCPRDHFTLRTINYSYDSNVLVDRCPQCMGVYVDRGELEQLARFIKGNRAQRALGQLIAEASGPIGGDEADAIDSWESAVGVAATFALRASPLQFIALRDDVACERFPFETVGLIAVNVVLFVLTFSDVVNWKVLALVPQEILVGDRFHALMTSVFVHADIFHVGFNMLYLWIFGDNVEDQLGRWWYLPFYLGCGLVASLAQVISDVNSTLPILGASGAVAGVLGAYLLFFPTGRVQVLVFWRIVEIPAVYFISFWFVVQLASAMFFREHSGIAWFAHLGGFVTGVLTALAVKQYQAYGDSGQR